MTKKVIVIGAGPGGYPAALKAASLGAQVTLIEKNKAGGVCLNCGCIPSKSLLDAAHRFYDLHILKTLVCAEAQNAADVLYKNFDFEKIQTRRSNVIAKLQQGLLGTFKKAKINYIEGEASFVSNSQIKAAGKIFDFDAAVIAAGTKAFFPPPFDKYKDKLHDNSTIFNLKKVPSSLVIIGGGVIGCEFACIFNALGCKVTIIEMMPSIIPFEDEAPVRILRTSLEKRGIEIKTGRIAKDITFENELKNILLDDGSVICAQEVLVAVGRSVELASLNLKAADISYGRKGISVNPKTMQAKDNIYAVGDVNGICLLAHAAHAQGETAAKNIMGINALYNNEAVPKAIYTWPEIASVGLNKKEAEAKAINAKVYKSFFMANGRALTQEATEGFVQIVADEKTDKIIGAQIAGTGASEMIHIPQMAILSGLTTHQLEENIFAHPTMSEAIKDALAKAHL
ncbi:MAG: dihydrolipoyl dehydrogenase [Elusimicrobiota bacterium]|jgi:dihydrolipoamide dehydrogenase|nr:dihydrolipoyl dehydrogenase [Elusimicrobiota bacterium]